ESGGPLPHRDAAPAAAGRSHRVEPPDRRRCPGPVSDAESLAVGGGSVPRRTDHELRPRCRILRYGLGLPSLVVGRGRLGPLPPVANPLKRAWRRGQFQAASSPVSFFSSPSSHAWNSSGVSMVT